jgi:hypothetical protein
MVLLWVVSWKLQFFDVSAIIRTHGHMVLIFSQKTRTCDSLILKMFENGNWWLIKKSNTHTTLVITEMWWVLWVVICRVLLVYARALTMSKTGNTVLPSEHLQKVQRTTGMDTKQRWQGKGSVAMQKLISWLGNQLGPCCWSMNMITLVIRTDHKQIMNNKIWKLRSVFKIVEVQSTRLLRCLFEGPELEDLWA